MLRKYNRNRKDKPYYRFFFAGFFVRVLSAFFYILIYKYYYGVGDVFSYYYSICQLNDLLFSDPLRFLDIVSSPFNNYHYDRGGLHHFFLATDESLIVKIGGCLSIFAGKSFLALAVLFSFLHFIGVWKLYKLFYKMYPTLYKQFAIAILFIPSVFFWGATMSKESITMFSIGIATYGIFQYYIFKNRRLKYLLGLFISLFFLMLIKIYIILAFVPAFVILIVFMRTRQIRSRFLRVMTLPMLIIIFGTGISYFAINYSAALGKYSIENVASTAVTNYLYLTGAGIGSAYDLGTFEPTLPSIASKFVPSVNVTLFRPYPWEVSNPVMLLSVLESLFALLFTLLVLIKVGPFSVIKRMLQNPIILFCFILSIIFSFAVGLTSGNFGTLVRYKIPILPFYFVGLILLQNANKLVQPNYNLLRNKSK